MPNSLSQENFPSASDSFIISCRTFHFTNVDFLPTSELSDEM